MTKLLKRFFALRSASTHCSTEVLDVYRTLTCTQQGILTCQTRKEIWWKVLASIARKLTPEHAVKPSLASCFHSKLHQRGACSSLCPLVALTETQYRSKSRQDRRKSDAQFGPVQSTRTKSLCPPWSFAHHELRIGWNLAPRWTICRPLVSLEAAKEHAHRSLCSMKGLEIRLGPSPWVWTEHSGYLSGSQ